MALLHNFRLKLFSSILICCKHFTQSVRLHNTGSEVYQKTSIQNKETIPEFITNTAITFVCAIKSNFCIAVDYLTVPVTLFISLSVFLTAVTANLLLIPATFLVLSAYFIVFSGNLIVRSANLALLLTTFTVLSGFIIALFLIKTTLLYFLIVLILNVTAYTFWEIALFSGKHVLSKPLFNNRD